MIAFAETAKDVKAIQTKLSEVDKLVKEIITDKLEPFWEQ
jgi:hypothetical protein